MKFKQFITAIAAVLLSNQVNAYPTQVHVVMIDAAAKKSVLSQPTIWQQFGFTGVQHNNLAITPYRTESPRIIKEM